MENDNSEVGSNPTEEEMPPTGVASNRPRGLKEPPTLSDVSEVTPITTVLGGDKKGNVVGFKAKGQLSVEEAMKTFDEEDQTRKEQMLEFLKETAEQIKSGDVVGMVCILIHDDDDQSDVVFSDANDYEIAGRLQACASDTLEGIYSIDN